MSRRERGFALLIVLWMLVPLALLFQTLTGNARTDSHLAFNLRDAARLAAAADGGLDSAIFGLLQTGGTAPLRLQVGGADIRVEVRPLSGLVNPNLAAADLLRALLIEVGTEPAAAGRAATAIVDWRTAGNPATDAARAALYRAAGRNDAPPGAPFETLSELGRVLGVTPRMEAALRPLLTLYSDRPPEPALAPPPIRAALASLGITQSGPPLAGNLFQLTATATLPDGAVAVRQATIRLGTPDKGRPWRVLEWG